MKITDFVTKENYTNFSHYRQGVFYYLVGDVNTYWTIGGGPNGENTYITVYMFPVPVEDLGEATLNNIEKSVFMMRYIRKALEDGTLVKVQENGKYLTL